MAEVRVTPQGEPPVVPPPGARTTVERPVAAEPSLGELFRQLAQESTTLIRQEVALAKTEMRENMRSLMRDVTMIVVGGVIAFIGVLTLTAFLVILLGTLLLNYWLAALIVGALFLLIGGVLAWTNLNNLRKGELKPEHTIDSLKEDKQWIQQEIQEVKRELT